MSKELEALQEVREQLIYYKEYAKEKLPTKAKQIDDECEEELNLIETTLKKIESPLTKGYLAYENKNLREKVDELIKEYKALKLDRVHKLGQLEDIEEEIGIDLITLFKALEDSMWFKHYDKQNKTYYIWDAHCYMKPLLNVYNKSIEIKEYVDNGGGAWFVDCDVVYLKDYRKTWALTKEELENGQSGNQE